MNSFATNEKFVQGILSLLGWSWSFSLGDRGRFLAASSISSTITIVPWVTVATGHVRTTRNNCVKRAWPCSQVENTMKRRKEIQKMIPEAGKADPKRVVFVRQQSPAA